MSAAWFLLLTPLAALVGLLLWRWSDVRRESAAWRALAATAEAEVARFDPAMVEQLPEPVRRYFLATIRPGTPLRTVAIIEMTGEIGLGTRDDPRYQPMRARQILAPPNGFVWRLSGGRGAMRLTGSDGLALGRSWSRFWLFGTVPAGRTGGNADHLRSAFARAVAEAVFWAPAALLPGDGVEWEAVTSDVARTTMWDGGLSQAVEVKVDAEGHPIQVAMSGWTDANPERVYRLQPFGGHLSDFREFEGFVLPARVEGGNMIGSEDYFPFYRAEVTAIRFPFPQ